MERESSPTPLTLGYCSVIVLAMSELNLSDLRAIETVLKVMSPLDPRDQVRVLAWVIDKLDLALDMKLAIKGASSKWRSYIDMAWEKVPHLMDSVGEFLAAASPGSMADRVLVVATFLQLQSDDPDKGILSGREINLALRKARLGVANVTDCIYTLMRRSPPHMLETGRMPNRKHWKGYRVTESGISYVYERIVEMSDEK
jgi:hypothetical protein